MENMINEQQLETMRSKAKKRLTIVLVLSIASLPLYMWLFYLSMYEQEGMSLLFFGKLFVLGGVFAIGTLGVLWYLLVRRSYNKFNENYKSKYVIQVLEGVAGFGRLEYHHKNGFSWDDIRNAAVVACGEKRCYESEDLLVGEYENVRFQISDVVTRKLVRRDGKTKAEEIFSGQVICLFGFDDSKVSNGHVQIFEKEFLSDFSGWRAEHEIHTENEVFQNRFRVYAADAHNAYYILTPQRMEKIMEFADTIEGQVSLVFDNERLYVAVKRESMFDAVVDLPVREQTEKIRKDADFIRKAKEILVTS